MTKRKFGILSLGASVSLAIAMAYGCSDDAPTVTPVVDAGPRSDSPTVLADQSVPPPVDTGVADTNIADTNTADTNTADTSTPDPTARATLAPTGSVTNGMGTVDFVESNGAVGVKVAITNATPGTHAMHIHNVGSCDDGGLAAGPHWNPADASHGFPDGATHHPGDFGNFTIDDAGAGSLSLTLQGVTLVGDGSTSAIGHAVIFHAGVDDGMGVNGDAGARPACGIIQRTN